MQFMLPTFAICEEMLKFLQSYQQTRNDSNWKHLVQTEVRKVTHPTCTKVRPIAYP